MSKTARTPIDAAPEPRTPSRTIAQAAERALHPPLAPTPAPDPESVRDETAEQAHASEEAEASAVEDAAPDQPEEPQEGLSIQGGLLHSKRDVAEAMAQVQAAVAAFARRGVMVAVDSLDLNTLRPRAQALALCRLLVRKGILAQEEIQYEEAAALLEMLAKVYQMLEEQSLAARRPVVAKRADLIVPGRQ